MLLILAILLLLATPLTVLGLRRARARMGAQWLLAAIGALLAWVSVWLLRAGLPRELTLLRWSDGAPFLEDPMLLADSFSWPFALALATLALAVILTGIGKLEDIEAGTWTGSLAVSALGILAALAGNPLTLVLAWVALDVLELILLLLRTGDPVRRRSVVLFFATNVLGTFLVLYADAAARAGGMQLTFEHIPADVGIYLFLAAGLRLGVLPLHMPFIREPDLRRGFGTVLRLVSPASSLVLLGRAAAGGILVEIDWLLLLLLGFTALYAAIAWARSSDEMIGRPFWILALASLAFAAALQNAPFATLAWSLACVFTGAALFLSARPGRARWLLGGLGLAGFLGLPFTPTAAAMRLYLDFTPLLMPFALAHAFLVAGYLRFLLKPLAPMEAPAERWIGIVYPAGLALVVASHWVVTLPLLREPAPLWPAGVALGMAALLAALGRRRVALPDFIFTALDALFSLRWLFAALERLMQAVGRAVAVINRLLEGEGGVLWALLLVLLLLTLVQQLLGGGG